MTDLVERYLAAVERRLPKEAAKDIVAELREALEAKLEARESETGHPPSADDVADMLKGLGHPAIVATRYSGRDHLIGPRLYPWFWDAVRAGVGIVVAISLVLLCIRALASDEPMRFVMRSIDEVLEGAIFTFGLIAVVFIILERTGADLKLASTWNPKSLPREHIRKPKTLFESGVSLFFDVLFILFWTSWLKFPNELPLRDGASVAITLSPAWALVYWPVLGLAVFAAAGHILDMLHPAWSRLRSAMSIAGYAGGLGVLWVLFQERPFVDVQPQPGTSPEELERALRLVDGVCLVSLGVAALVWAIALGVEVHRQIRATRFEAPGQRAAV